MCDERTFPVYEALTFVVHVPDDLEHLEREHEPVAMKARLRLVFRGTSET
jgi:hypothetical protein